MVMLIVLERLHSISSPFVISTLSFHFFPFFFPSSTLLPGAESRLCSISLMSTSYNFYRVMYGTYGMSKVPLIIQFVKN